MWAETSRRLSDGVTIRIGDAGVPGQMKIEEAFTEIRFQLDRAREFMALYDAK